MKNQLPKLKESQLQTLLMNYLTAQGYYVQRMNSGKIPTKDGHMVRLNKVGTPDIMAFRDNNDIGISGSGDVDLLFVEVKTPQNPNPTLLQKVKMQELEEHGARCLVVHSLEELKELL